MDLYLRITNKNRLNKIQIKTPFDDKNEIEYTKINCKDKIFKISYIIYSIH